MKRRINIAIWAGFLVVILAFVAEMTVFVRFPVTRDTPWAALSLCAAGLLLSARGLVRAYRQPALYRGRVAGPILASMALALVAFFGYGLIVMARQLPASSGAPQVGWKAPDFTLPDKDGNPVALAELLGAEGTGGALLIFHRGHW
ncbi:MAG: hypothetical protein ACRD6R_13790 [Candidatus Polarisedimenticolia bacterium]